MAISKQKLHSLKNDLIKFIQSGQFKKAEKLYPSVRGREIQDAELWRLFASVHAQRGNIAEIAYCCKNIIKTCPEDHLTAFNYGAALQNLERNDEAIQQYENCIKISPGYINAYTNCAYLYLLTGHPEKAANYYRRSLESNETPELRIQYGQALIASDNREIALQQFNYVLHNNPEDRHALFSTAQCYYEMRDYTDSEKYYLKFLSLDSKNINAINNLGRLYEETGKYELAIEKYQQAIEIDSSIAIIHNNLGKALVKMGNLIEAEKEFDRCVQLAPEYPETYFNLGKLYNDKSDIKKAKEYFSKALSMDIEKSMEKPDEFVLAVKYFLSNLDSPESFDEDKKAFVANLFDGYANKFDLHLVQGLQYKTPEIINELMLSHISKKDNITLDLGCGTGLCCKYLSKQSTHITGVDLSPGMIDKARELDCYNDLVVGEISEFINTSDRTFDLVVAADVFVYIGVLKDIFHACSNNMSSNAYLIFSTEHLPDEANENYRLLESGRYKHSNTYINQLSSDYDFALIDRKFCTLRKENGKDVKGCVVVMRKNH